MSAEALVAAGEVSELAVPDGLGLPEPPLKSVAYQPDPLSWKPAAVICLVNVD